MSRAPEKTADAGEGHGTAGQYLSVWGDTVRGRRLLIGVITGVVCGLAGLYGGQALFAALGLTPDMAEVWSLITGIAGCVVAGVITARITSPARVVSDDAHDSAMLAATIRELGAEGRGLGRLEDASALSRSEIEAAGLTGEFREAEAAAEAAVASGADAPFAEGAAPTAGEEGAR
ncbi:hypothetical protein [Brevibacterium album]|uniref:hypothetical protein n=1 Tax=Brevibacterium album TaxID=417948 RepID=UPI000408D57A|nr:hypothetical protein [Brevibacterium album]